MLKLNIGSGQRKFKRPFLNIDCQEKWQPDMLADASSLPMFENASADLVVLHHVLEHFGLGEADALLAECRRVLAPGGSLLIFLPDVAALAKRWLRREIDDYTFFVNLMGAYMGDEADRHKWHYTAESLGAALRNVGSWSILSFDWRRIEGADIARDWWIMGVEAIRL